MSHFSLFYNKVNLSIFYGFYFYFLGLQIIYTYDEVAFIQNLVFYIEMAYRTPVSHFTLTSQNH